MKRTAATVAIMLTFAAYVAGIRLLAMRDFATPTTPAPQAPASRL
jgi:hypothetical protein